MKNIVMYRSLESPRSESKQGGISHILNDQSDGDLTRLLLCQVENSVVNVSQFRL